MDINTDPSYSKTSDADVAFSSSKDLDITMASGGNSGHSHQYSSLVAAQPIGILTLLGNVIYILLLRHPLDSIRTYLFWIPMHT